MNLPAAATPPGWDVHLHANAVLPGLGRRHVVYMPPLRPSTEVAVNALIDLPVASPWLDHEACHLLRNALLAGGSVLLAFPEGDIGLEDATCRLANFRREITG